MLVARAEISARCRTAGSPTLSWGTGDPQESTGEDSGNSLRYGVQPARGGGCPTDKDGASRPGAGPPGQHIGADQWAENVKIIHPYIG